MSKKESVTVLRDMLGKMFDKMYQGAGIETHALAQGLADGYMRALVDLSVVNDTELFKLIQEERRNAAFKADQTLVPQENEQHAPSSADPDGPESVPRTHVNYA
jgi:hypothetical protein